jgi:hypothetical protein
MNKKKTKFDFATIFHLAEVYAEQYNEKNLCLSPEQNDACFRDIVNQYYYNLRWGKNQSLVINTDIPLF